jgi:NAD(P)-dependent dehydrogenase (short-subunit alcohol dehydrogenase family)
MQRSPAPAGYVMGELDNKVAVISGAEQDVAAEVDGDILAVHCESFLTSDRASFVSGAVIAIDGGWSAKLA